MLQAYFLQNSIEAGCDEAGRGCLAGPVVAAAVILKDDFHHDLLNDSKQLSETQRKLLEPFIISNSISIGLGIVTEREIEEINILNASFLAMHRAIRQLSVRPEHLIVDGNRFNKYQDIPHACIVKGDAKFRSIAAASVLAKNNRDRIMDDLDIKFPMYGWRKNKGYPTKQHRKAIAEFGASNHHRMTFNLLGISNQLDLFHKQ
jgi:ribonuclease HII